MTIRIGGWLRLWVVGCIVYGAIVVDITVAEFPKVEGIAHNESYIKRLSDQSLLILAGRVQPAFPADAPAWARAPIVLEMPNGYTMQAPGNTTQEQAKEVVKDYAGVLQTMANEQRLSAIAKGLILWLVPCFVVLAMGLAVRWIYRGFRAGTPNLAFKRDAAEARVGRMSAALSAE